MEEKVDLSKSIQFVKGVGPAKLELLKKIGIEKVKDLTEYFPRNYEDRTKLININEFEDGRNALFIAEVLAPVKVQKIRKNLVIYSTIVGDETGKCKLTWFNQMFIRNRLRENTKYIFCGKVSSEFSRGSIIDHPQIYNLTDLKKVMGLYPLYSLTSGITQNYLFKLMSLVYDSNPIFNEFYSDEFKKSNNLCDLNYAMKNIHFPKDQSSINIARERLIFDELFLMELALMSIKNNSLSEKKTTIFKNTDISKFLKIIPFELTNAQKKVVDDIKKDFISEKVMNRLVQGDVGCGKTIIAAIAMYIAVINGYQAALMAPTTILANQHYKELKLYMEKLGINVDIITSSTTKKNKEKIIEKLKDKKIDIIIGTHSLIEDNIEFNNLGIVITDEQHRFGVKQRIKLTKKSDTVETLVMSATPIPRTLAITLYGDLDISIIDEMPPGRNLVKTFIIDEKLESRVNVFIKKQVELGRQVYVVCPLVQDSESLDLTSVEKLYNKYKNDIFTDLDVEYLHGKMKNKEKDEIMQRFKENKINILISTTVIEVGISVSNATVMVVEDADRFGLAALHQLRGRVGRGAYESYCILKSSNKSESARERLKIMEKSNSGFEIAQRDLELRGPGDFFGIRQSGLPEFKIANLLNDIKVLKKATYAAKEVLKKDKFLKDNSNLKINQKLIEKFGEQLKVIGS
ncbi:MAG: ATP-dependent DNA helicase RecG [Clostridia bacterium]